jgi:hypothetical protein
MPGTARPGFLSLVALFLQRMPVLWIGGVGASVAHLLMADVGPWAAAAVAVVVAGAALAVELAIDRRRISGRRLLFRGATLSPRRAAALVVTLLLISGTTTAIAANVFATMLKSAADEVRRQSAPNVKRGRY